MNKTYTRKIFGDRVAYLFLFPTLILLLVFFYYPFVEAFIMSFYDWPLMGEKEFIGLENYFQVFIDANALKSWKFTFLWTLIITPCIFIFGLIIAFLTSGHQKFMGVFRSIYFMPTTLMTIASGVIWLWFFRGQPNGLANYIINQLGIADKPINWLGDVPQSIFSVAFAGTWMWVGLTAILLVGAIQSIPDEIQESAIIDGASGIQRAWYITLPLIRPTFGLALIISVIGSFLSFPEFLILTKGGPAYATTPILMYIYNISFKYHRFGYGAALSVLLMLVLIVLTVFQLKIIERE